MNIKDYLHLYLGCIITTHHNFRPNGKESIGKTGYAKLTGDMLADIENKTFPFTPKPLLRPLSSMTKDEMKELWQKVFGRPFHENGRFYSFDAKGNAPKRIVMRSGVDRLGIEEDGNIWYDSDLNTWRYNQHLITQWLLSKNFDLFGLIDAGLAIDKTKHFLTNQS